MEACSTRRRVEGGVCLVCQCSRNFLLVKRPMDTFGAFWNDMRNPVDMFWTIQSTAACRLACTRAGVMRTGRALDTVERGSGAVRAWRRERGGVSVAA